MKIVKEHRCHGGLLRYVEHESAATKCTMRYSVFLPIQAEYGICPAVLYLAGLTCTEDNFTTKANAYQKAAELGLIILAPDTSPRGEEVANDEAYDLGQGAGFYVNATQAPWKTHFQMENYIVDDLLSHVAAEYPIDTSRIGIMGHSMGGHGALTLYLKYPEKFKTASAFSPICTPIQCPWGKKAFTAYLGEDQQVWEAHDAAHLMEKSHENWPFQRLPILIDQGTADDFLQEQLNPHVFEAACLSASHPLTLRMQGGYDHSYFFIQSFIDDHLEHHKKYSEK